MTIDEFLASMGQEDRPKRVRLDAEPQELTLRKLTKMIEGIAHCRAMMGVMHKQAVQNKDERIAGETALISEAMDMIEETFVKPAAVAVYRYINKDEGDA